MNTRSNPILAAQRNLQARQMAVPRGAQYGAIAGQAQGQAMQRRPVQGRQANPGQMQLSPLMRQRIAQAQGMAIPQGADAANLAGCGDGDCMDLPYAAPFVGFPTDPQPWMQPAAIIPIQATFGTPAEPTVTLQISCGNSLFYGCGARSFNAPGEVNILSAFSGANDSDLFCPGSGGLDLSYFNTNGNSCMCDFDWGCFSSFFPLIIEFGQIGTPSTAPLINMAIGGSRLQGGNACGFWPGLTPGYPGIPGTPYGGALPGTGMVP